MTTSKAVQRAAAATGAAVMEPRSPNESAPEELTPIEEMREIYAPHFGGRDVLELAVQTPDGFQPNGAFDGMNYAALHRVIGPPGVAEIAVSEMAQLAARLNGHPDRPALTAVRLDLRSDDNLRGYRVLQADDAEDVFAIAVGLPAAGWNKGLSVGDPEAFQPFIETRMSGPRGLLEDFLARLKVLIRSYRVEAPDLDFSTEPREDEEDETAAAESAPAGRPRDDASDDAEPFCLTLYDHTGANDPVYTVWIAGTESGTIDLMNGLVSRAADDYAKRLNAERRPGPRPARAAND